MNIKKAVTAAQGALGTPFHHQGRASGIGLDCIGLIVHALKASGFEVADQTDYGRKPESTRLIAALERHGFRQVEKIAAGDVLVFRITYAPQHVALAVSNARMVHAYAPAGRVVETEIGDSWRRRLAGIYRYQKSEVRNQNN